LLQQHLQLLRLFVRQQPVIRTGVVLNLDLNIGREWFRLTFRPAPVMRAFLPRDAEQPRGKLRLIPQRRQMPGRGNERFLHDVEGDGVVADHVHNEDMQRQLMPFEQGIPGIGVTASGGPDQLCFIFCHAASLFS